jgi:glycosyltransferase involved in cell wall biosynthesis
MKPLHIVTIGADLNQKGGIATFENLILKYAPPEFAVKHISSHDEGSLLHRFAVFAICLVELLSSLLTQTVDIIYIQISDGGSLLRKAIITQIALIFGKSVVMHAHGAEFPNTYERLPRRARGYLSWLFRQCRAFIVLSSSWKDYYVDKCGVKTRRVIVMNNPTELPELVPDRAQQQDPITLIFCGRIGQRKGAFDLLRAYAQIPPQLQKRSRLILAGDGDLSTAQTLVTELQVADRVIFPGWIDAETREKLLAEADIFLLPSYHEGLPMAILEGMGWGLPIVSTYVGGIPEVIVDNFHGILLTPGDIDGLSNAIATLIEDRALRLSLGNNAKNSVRSFDIKNYWQDLAKIFYRASLYHNHLPCGDVKRQLS